VHSVGTVTCTTFPKVEIMNVCRIQSGISHPLAAYREQHRDLELTKGATGGRKVHAAAQDAVRMIDVLISLLILNDCRS
jgi:hypothetical protein